MQLLDGPPLGCSRCWMVTWRCIFACFWSCHHWSTRGIIFVTWGEIMVTREYYAYRIIGRVAGAYRPTCGREYFDPWCATVPLVPLWRAPTTSPNKNKKEGCAQHGLRAPYQCVRIEFEAGWGPWARLPRSCFARTSVRPEKPWVYPLLTISHIFLHCCMIFFSNLFSRDENAAYEYWRRCLKPLGEAWTPEEDGPGLSELNKKWKSRGCEPSLLVSKLKRPIADPKEKQWLLR